MIEIKQGDLMKAKEDVIAHQVNCKGVMGSGVAKQIKNRYPEVYEEYSDLCKSGKNIDSDVLLGNALLVNIDKGKEVCNLFGQLGYGRDKQHTDIKALQNSLIALRDYAWNNDKTVAMPYKMASDRGGADWNEVYNLIDELFVDLHVVFYKI